MFELKPISTAPKTGANWVAYAFLGWCPDETAVDGGDWRVCWWEPAVNGGCWWGDRDLPETPTLWTELPPVPSNGGRA